MSWRYKRAGRGGRFPKQRSVEEWKQRALTRIAKLRASGEDVQPVEIEGRTISKTVWGKAWCKNLEAYSDYESRLPRGRSYVRHNSVLHLMLEGPDAEAGRPTGRIHGLVDGQSINKVTLKVVPLSAEKWQTIKDACAGEIDSLIELLQGKLSSAVLEIVTQPGRGLFPSADEIDLHCSCPDWAKMCKHVAACLYGIGARLDTQPEMLFKLRGVDPADLIAEALEHNAAEAAPTSRPTLNKDELVAIFGLEINFDEIDIEHCETRKAPAAPAPAPVPPTEVPIPTLPPRANRLLDLIREQPGLCTPALIKGIRSRRYATTKALSLLKRHNLVEFRRSPKPGGYFALSQA